MTEETIPLSRHAEIVHSIYREQASEHRILSVILGHQGERGHRYFGERCVWCGVNYLDELLENVPDCGPSPNDWFDGFWPIAKVDAVLAEHRASRKGKTAST